MGDDGETHQGIYDVAFLSTIPGVTILSAATYHELRWMLKHALYQYPGVVAVRYPRGAQPETYVNDDTEAPALYKYVLSQSGEKKVLAVTYGRLMFSLNDALKQLDDSADQIAVMKLNQIHPIPVEAIQHALEYDTVCFLKKESKVVLSQNNF